MEKLIVKYLENNITDKELETLSIWLDNDENKQVFKDHIQLKYKIDSSIRNLKADISFENIKKQAFVKKKSRSLKFYRYAALFILLLTLSIGGFNFFNEDNKTYNDYITLKLADGEIIPIEINSFEKTLKKNEETIGVLKNGALFYNKGFRNEKHTITVPKGKIFNVTLSDNTNIVINSDTKITYNSNFNNLTNRSVDIKGEAFFDVSKNKKKPFFVNTKDIKVSVLGTRFNVSNYANDKKTSVVLEEGAVEIKSNLKENIPILLKPGEEFVLSEKQIQKKTALVEKHIAWKKGKLYFKDDKFNDIIKELERHYNISILSTSIKQNNKRYTGTFYNESITDIFDAFQEISNFEYHTEGSSIKITSKK